VYICRVDDRNWISGVNIKKQFLNDVQKCRFLKKSTTRRISQFMPQSTATLYSNGVEGESGIWIGREKSMEQSHLAHGERWDSCYFLSSVIYGIHFSDTLYHFCRRSWTTWQRTRRACDQRDVSLTRQLRTLVRTTYVR